MLIVSPERIEHWESAGSPRADPPLAGWHLDHRTRENSVNLHNARSA